MDLSASQTSPYTVPLTRTWPSQEDSQSVKDRDQPFENPFEIFDNPFEIEDLLVFDDLTLQRILNNEGFHLTIEDFAHGLRGGSNLLIERIEFNLSEEQRSHFKKLLSSSLAEDEIKVARQRILDNLFWELTYWKMPELYDELTEGEQLNPSIFQHLEPDVHSKVVLDAAAGTGRATLECLRHEAKLIYAVDPSADALHILEQKLANPPEAHRVITRQGSFEQLPLENDSVDTAIACSAFTSEPGRGGEVGLAELRRVTRSGGKIVIIWPGLNDYDWLARHGFQYIAFPANQKAAVRFRSLESALRCVQIFYAGNKAAVDYLLERQEPEIPYSVLGFNQPSDYCWLMVEK